ncbi:hypothetical protein [Haladaptatus sp. DFWS20]|uniref:hypothetical protein n=1 Tax=Haladaptatus sp. DFWS20 TaxID=3403467 RepID=UPI003EBAE9C8
MIEKNKHSSRRDVLKLSGTTLAALSSLSLAGTTSADVPCDCNDGGGGTGSPPAAPQTGHYTVGNGEVELSGWTNGDGGDAWFEWGEVGDGFPHDTELRRVDAYETFTGTRWENRGASRTNIVPSSPTATDRRRHPHGSSVSEKNRQLFSCCRADTSCVISTSSRTTSLSKSAPPG